MADAYPAFGFKYNSNAGTGSGPMGGPGPFAPSNTPVYSRRDTPVNRFLDSIGVAKVDENGQATGTTGGSTFMWNDQRAQYNELLGAEQRQAAAEAQARQNGQNQQGGQQQQPAQPQPNSFLPPAATGGVQINGLAPAMLAPGGTPMVGREYAAPVEPGAGLARLGSFAQGLLNGGPDVKQNGAIFSGAGGKLSITQDAATVPDAGGPRGGTGFDPNAIARYQMALASGRPLEAALSAYRTPIPEGANLSEQEMAALAADDMRLNRQAMEVAKYVADRGMAPNASQPAGVYDNRMAYINSLGGTQQQPNRFIPAGTPATTATGADAIRAKLNQRPVQKVEVVVGDEVVTMDANTRQVLGRAPRTALPAGYERAPDGALRPMAGTKDAIERQQNEERVTKAKESALTQVNAALTAVNEATLMVGRNTAGLGGWAMSIIPGTEASNLKATISTIKANLGFDQLNALREASKTGGALGQVSEKELDFLQSTIASLDTDQSPEQLLNNLYKIKYHYERLRDSLNGIDPDKKDGPRALTPDQYKRLNELRSKNQQKSNQAARPGTRS